MKRALPSQTLEHRRTQAEEAAYRFDEVVVDHEPIPRCTTTGASTRDGSRGGQPLLRWSAPRPRNVLVVDGEMPPVSLQERLRMISAGFVAPVIALGIEEFEDFLVVVITDDANGNRAEH